MSLDCETNVIASEDIDVSHAITKNVRKRGPRKSYNADEKRTVSAVTKVFISKMLEVLPPEYSAKQKFCDVKIISEALIKVLVEGAESGESITFTNMFTFKRALRDGRTHKNPRNSVPVYKPAHYVLTMEVKPQLKQQFNSIEIPTSHQDASAQPELMQV